MEINREIWKLSGLTVFLCVILADDYQKRNRK